MAERFNAPERGFPEIEYQQRLEKAQNRMAQHGLSALLLTTEPDIRYFTGFLTRFWESPTRPWFLLIPAKGKPIAVFPSIGTHLISQSWIDDIRTWQSPNYQDDGIGLLVETLSEIVPQGGKIGVPSGIETHLHMPIDHWERLKHQTPLRIFTTDHDILKDLRFVKSEAEIAKITYACAIANRAFKRVGEIAEEGVPLSKVFRGFQMLCLDEGADWVPYLAGAAAHKGYSDVISPASDQPLHNQDILMLDTGLIWDGYFCDFDRNFSVGAPDTDLADRYKTLIEVTHLAFESAKPGVTFADLFHVMNNALGGGEKAAEAGRLGHGLGMQLTEGPSIIPDDHTVLKEGVVLTLEPSIELPNGKLLVHEENIVITAHGARFLSDPASTELLILKAYS